MSRKYRVLRDHAYDRDVCDTDSKMYAFAIANLLNEEFPADAPHIVVRVDEEHTEIHE